MFSEINGFSSNMRNLETNKSFQVCGIFIIYKTESSKDIFKITIDTSMLPRGEENHATICLGMAKENLNDEEVFDLDQDLDLQELETINYTPIFLFLWKSKFSLLLRSKQLLCETYQGED